MLRLVARLDEEGVAFCHWKSNFAIDRSASGENDLDLLVSRAGAEAFRTVLRELGFVRIINPSSNVPGTESYYAFSEEGRRWVNVHAHFRLVLGHDRTKSQRLPLEDLFLQRSTTRGIFPLPPPELEYLVLVIRLVLKYAIWDEIAWNSVRREVSRPKRSEQAELDDLMGRIDRAQMTALLDEHLPFISRRLFADCEAALRPGAPLTLRVRTAAALERALEPWSRSFPTTDAARRIARRADVAARRRLHRLPGNRRADGGAMIAVLGGDGSGKTTAVTETVAWLGGAFEVHRIHLGKPPWSRTTTATRATAKAASIGASSLDRVVRSRLTERLTDTIDTYRPLVWHLCTARDRRLTYRRASRQLARGVLVVSDRYPHELLRLMDVPQIERLTAGRIDNRLVRAMARREAEAHRAIAPPDLLAVLRLDPEIAVVRKVDEPAESVRIRGAEIWNADWSGTRAHVIDATGTKEQVAAELRAVISEALR